MTTATTTDAETLALLRKALVSSDDLIGWVEDSSICRDRYLAALDILGEGERVRRAASESGYPLKTPAETAWMMGGE